MNRQNGADVVDFEYGYISGSNRLDYVWDNEIYYYDGPINLSHDRNGNMTNGKGITATTYDWRNLPLSITVTKPVFPFTPITHEYRYDHSGHRVYSSVDQTYTVRGAYGEPIAEYAGSTPALKYWHYIRPDGVVIGRKEGSNRFYYHRDHLGSTRAVLSHHSSPNVVETYDYMPFGELMAGRILTSGTGTRPKYTGHAFDTETDLHNMHWRRQIPRYGVFRTPDPMADEYPGWNPYAYVMNDPMRYLDPTGLCPADGSAGLDVETGRYCTRAIVVTADRYHGPISSFYRFYADNYARYGDPGPSVSYNQFMTGLDAAGTMDPTGVVDLTAATIYAFQGDFANAGISLASILPAGDLLKATRVATKGVAKGGGKYLYHYTSEAAAQSISKPGLRTGKDGFLYLTNKGSLSPLQAQIELALPANRALPTSILRIDASGLSPSLIRRVSGNLSGYGAGGGTEFLFNQNIPANLIKIVK